LAARVKRKKLY